MATSFTMMKKELGIVSYTTIWNATFPYSSLAQLYANNRAITSFLAETARDNLRVTTQDLLKLGILAESKGILLAYYISGNHTVDLFFQPLLNTKEWMAKFKGVVPRRHFFDLVYAAHSIKEEKSLFPMSTFYNLISPKLPIQCTGVNIYPLSDSYILIQYLNDASIPDYRVVKVGTTLEELKPTLTYSPDDFACLTLTVDGKTFTGDSIKGISTNNPPSWEEVVEVNCNGITYCLDRDGFVWTYNDTGTGKVPKFKQTKAIRILTTIECKGQKMVVLSNGTVWILPENTFVNLTSIPALHSLNLSLFQFSSTTNGFLISTNPSSLEVVSSNIFTRYIAHTC